MKMGPVEISLLAKEILASPDRALVLYRGTNRVNRAALARVIEIRRFAEKAAAAHDAHPSPHNRDGKGWHKMRGAKAGKHSGAKPDFNFVR